MQRYRSPAIELYGSEGTIQLLGDDWAPEGWELWRNAEGAWRVFPESDPHWQWTEGLRHLVDCVEAGRPTITRPEHAYHALEIMLAAQAAGRDGVARRDRERLSRSRLRHEWLELDADGSPTTAEATMGYRPSPRPSFEAPTAIRRADAVRHTWGDEEAGFVEDWIYVSSQLLHAIVFGIPPGGAFRHSDSFRTMFAADELLHVLEGTLVLANPETGEVVRAEPGRKRVLPARHVAPRLLLRRRCPAGARVLRAAAGYRDVRRVRADEAVSRESIYAREGVVGNSSALSTPFVAAGASRGNAVWQLDRGVLVGLLVTTEHFTVGTLTVPPGSKRRGGP